VPIGRQQVSSALVTDTNTTGASAGHAVFMVSDNAVASANAASVDTALVVGFVGVVGPIGTGKILTSGNIPGAQFVPGLTLGAGDRVFLSLVDGVLTNTIAGLSSPNVMSEVGIVADAARYPVDGTASITFLPKTPVVL